MRLVIFTFVYLKVKSPLLQKPIDFDFEILKCSEQKFKLQFTLFHSQKLFLISRKRSVEISRVIRNTEFQFEQEKTTPE